MRRVADAGVLMVVALAALVLWLGVSRPDRGGEAVVTWGSVCDADAPAAVELIAPGEGAQRGASATVMATVRVVDDGPCY